jgi:hypothetical protein
LVALKMTIHLNKLFLIALSSCLLWGQFTTEQAISAPIIISNWKTLNRNNYSLKYPQDWDLQQSEDPKSGTVVSKTVRYQFAVLSPLEPAQDQFRENVNLVIEDLDGVKIDLDAYSRIAESQLKSQMKNCKILEHIKITQGRKPYYKTVWTWDYGAFPLKVEQYSWLLDGKAYILTFTSEQAKFAQFQAIGEKILDTFTFRK